MHKVNSQALAPASVCENLPKSALRYIPKVSAILSQMPIRWKIHSGGHAPTSDKCWNPPCF